MQNKVTIPFITAPKETIVDFVKGGNDIYW